MIYPSKQQLDAQFANEEGACAKGVPQATQQEQERWMLLDEGAPETGKDRRKFLRELDLKFYFWLFVLILLFVGMEAGIFD